jgi:hypothetical protein
LPASIFRPVFLLPGFVLSFAIVQGPKSNSLYSSAAVRRFEDIPSVYAA